MVDLTQLKARIDLCKEKIEIAKKKAARVDEVTLIGATKTQPKELIELIQENNLLQVVGENHVQEIVEKHDSGKQLTWHMIGQLQSNKVKYIVGKVALIHSLDRESLAKEIDKQAKKHNLIQDCLIEVNMGSELSKGGINKDDMMSFLEIIDKYDSIRIRGLMSVMPNLEEKKKLKELYEEFHKLFLFTQRMADVRHKIDILSCGMTNDFEMAIEHGGATMVRLGRVLFGERR